MMSLKSGVNLTRLGFVIQEFAQKSRKVTKGRETRRSSSDWHGLEVILTKSPGARVFGKPFAPGLAERRVGVRDFSRHADKRAQ